MFLVPLIESYKKYDLNIQIQLSPRSFTTSNVISTMHQNDISPSNKTRVNPFGNARPREEILARKGIDVKALDLRIENKAHFVHYTRVRSF